MVGEDWERASLHDVAREMIEPIAGQRFILEGPEIEIGSQSALSLSMALYELATNATKYGSLSVPEGTVEFYWKLVKVDNAERLLMRWEERGGPRPVEPNETGYGSFLTGRAVSMQTGGQASTVFAEGGVVWTLDMPSPRL